MSSSHSSVWIPTVFPNVGDTEERKVECDLRGCENSRTSEKALAAVRSFLSKRSSIRCHWNAQDRELRKKLSAEHSVPTKQIFLTAGAYGGLRAAIAVTSQKQLPWLLLEPDFPAFESIMLEYGKDFESLWYGGMPGSFDPSEVVQALEGREISGLLFSDPNVATGVRLSRKKVRQLLDWTDVPLIYDESNLVGHNSLAAAVNEFENLIVVRSLSKYYGLAGLRIGYIVVSPSMVEQFRNILTPAEVSGCAIVAGRAVLEDREYQTNTLRGLRQNRRLLGDAAEDCDWDLVGGKYSLAAYLMSSESTVDISSRLKNAGIVGVSGSKFGLEMGVRINISNPECVKKVAHALT